VRKSLGKPHCEDRKHGEKDLVVPCWRPSRQGLPLQEVCDAMREAVGFSMPA